MQKRFENNLTFIEWKGITYKIGDYVASGRTKGTIVAVDGKKFEFLLDTGKIISYSSIKHIDAPAQLVVIPTEAPPEKVKQKAPTPKFTTSSSRRSKEDCEREISRLQRELDRCNQDTQLPFIVQSAPDEVRAQLPEVRKENIVADIEKATEQLMVAVETNNKQEVRTAEKTLATAVSELKEVSHQATVQVSANGCRVQKALMRDKETIRIYFEKQPPADAKKELGKQGFRAYSEKIAGKTVWYWGVFYTEAKMKFALGFCGEAESETTETTSQSTKKDDDYIPLTAMEMGNLWGAERTSAIRKELQHAFPDSKFAVVKSSGNGCNVYLLESPYKFTNLKDSKTGKYKKTIYYDDRFTDDETEFLKKVRALIEKGVKHYETGDYGMQPSYYVFFEIGKHDKEYKYVPSKLSPAKTKDEVKLLNGEERPEAIQKDLQHYFPESMFSVVKNSGHSCDVFLRESPYEFKKLIAAHGKKMNLLVYFTQVYRNDGLMFTEDERAFLLDINNKVLIKYGGEYRSKYQIDFYIGGNGIPYEIVSSYRKEEKKEAPAQAASNVMSIDAQKAQQRKQNMQENKSLILGKSERTPKITLSPLLQELMPKHQQQYLRELSEEGRKELTSVIQELEQQVKTIKKSQENSSVKMVKAHYFYAGSDWYVTEYMGNGEVYGYALLNDDVQMSEWGYMSIAEFNEVGRVEMDFHWTPKPMDEVLYKRDPSFFPKPKSMKSAPAVAPKEIPLPDDDSDDELKDILNMLKETLKR